ncbi:tRNA pseudouridine(38-40) synthase TruA [Gaopeijia maritima]|uniref:tRNA pseudouridine synthase A n=1 Tax=Gaopeijia maritima TaxID=3119007 RepID=A0ABU9E8B0_9BACT
MHAGTEDRSPSDGSDDGQIRILLVLHYDGSGFHGWQVQPRLRTVQGEIEAIVERITGARRPVLGSGRTDAGVHATGQVATVSLPERWTPARARKALNALLPRDIWVESARQVPMSFHPRYDAVERSYRYRVGTAPDCGSPFHRPFCWALGEELDPAVLDRAAALLPGTRSFRSFAKAGQPQRGEICTVQMAQWDRWGDLGYAFTVRANRYLHHMVRYLVGTMVAVGLGRRELDEFQALLEDPECGAVTSPPAPPEGLYLERVRYPHFDDVPPRSGHPT